MEEFQRLCDYLKKYRITCDVLTISVGTKEQLSTLLKILKPVTINLDSEGSNRFEALYQSKILVSFVLFPFLYG